MISSNFVMVARKTWPFLCAFRLSTVSAFSFSTRETLSGSTQEFIFSSSNKPIQAWKPAGILSTSLLKTRCFSSSSDDFSTTTISTQETTTTSANFAMDPYSEEARRITKSLGINIEQHEKLTQLSLLVVEWNERLNLISRKDCNLEVVFGRHVLPSVALANLPQFKEATNKSSNPRIVDVGTGGGFPGLPLSVLFPEANFLLVDSIGKKLKAIDEMVSELELTNIETHHGRAEQIADDPIIGRKHRKKYDICVGRSVTAMPRFCFWIQDLLKKEGKLVYIIGGEVEKSVQSRVVVDVQIDDLLKCEGASDKRTLVLSSRDVVAVAKESGERKVTNTKRKSNKPNNKNKTRRSDEGKWNKSKGGWSDRDSSEQKERGYSNFKRYEK